MKIENAKILLESYQKYKNANLKNFIFDSALTLAIKKDFLEFAQELICLTNYFQLEVYFSINEENEESSGVFVDSLDSFMKASILENKYNKFHKS
ncbi:MAG: hypothetical protein ACP5G8_08505, partial [Athalassotoga sp.]